jgi:hypothetical protein
LMEAVLSGTGEAGRQVEAELMVRNLGPVEVEIIDLLLTNPDERVILKWSSAPFSESTLRVELSSWPSLGQMGSMEAVMVCRLPSGRLFRSGCELNLETGSLYERTDILGAQGGL